MKSSIDTSVAFGAVVCNGRHQQGQCGLFSVSHSADDVMSQFVGGFSLLLLSPAELMKCFIIVEKYGNLSLGRA